MSTLVSASPVTGNTGLRQAIARRPLLAYFGLAFLGTWTFFLPILLSQRAWGVIQLPDVAGLILFFLATYTGPFLAAFGVTAAVEGRTGVNRLAGRIVQWRVGLVWYLVLLLGYPLVFLMGLIPWFGATPFAQFAAQWPLYGTVFLPAVLMGLLLPSLGEETGWRGFALPRLQAHYGPLLGTLILGAIHALWHLPVYFVPGAILPGAFDPVAFVANSAAIVLSTIVWTWIFNGARGSVWIAILTHSVSNAVAVYLPALLGDLPIPTDPWLTAKLMGAWALVLIVATRGRLGYQEPTA